MTNEETRPLYEVPAQDGAGRPVTLRLQPNCAVVTIEVIQADDSTLAKVNISITHTDRFAGSFDACARGAARWPGGGAS